MFPPKTPFPGAPGAPGPIPQPGMSGNPAPSGGDPTFAGMGLDVPGPPPAPSSPVAGVSKFPLAYPNWLAGEAGGHMMDPDPPAPPQAPMSISGQLMSMPGVPGMPGGMGSPGAPGGAPSVGIGPQPMGGDTTPNPAMMGQLRPEDQGSL